MRQGWELLHLIRNWTYRSQTVLALLTEPDVFPIKHVCVPPLPLQCVGTGIEVTTVKMCLKEMEICKAALFLQNLSPSLPFTYICTNSHMYT